MANGKVYYHDKGVLPYWHKDYTAPKSKSKKLGKDKDLMREKVTKEAQDMNIPKHLRAAWINEQVKKRLEKIRENKPKPTPEQLLKKEKQKAKRKAKRKAKKEAQAKK